MSNCSSTAIALLVLDPHIKMLSGTSFQEKSRLVRWIALSVWLMLVLGSIAGPCWILCWSPPASFSERRLFTLCDRIDHQCYVVDPSG